MDQKVNIVSYISDIVRHVTCCRTGYAKVAHLTQVPVIPIYTENIRLAYRTLQTGSSLSRSD